MNDFQRYLAEEFIEDYQEGRLSRREALKLIGSVTGSLLLASSMLAACTPVPQATPTFLNTQSAQATNTPGAGPTITNSPGAQPTSTQSPTDGPPSSQPSPHYGTVSPDNPSVEAGDVQFPGEGVTLTGYLAQVKGQDPLPVVLVCHENRDLTDHIKDVARRLAVAGYVALAVDLLSRQGGTGTVGFDNVPGALANTPEEQFIQDFTSAWRYLQGLPFAQAERVGMVSFCFGGGVTWRVATKMRELLAAVPFYGPHPPIENVKDINAAVLAIYAERDQRINQGIPAIEAAMQEHGKIYEKVIYPDTDHAFHNDTGSRYNPEAARDAWKRTLEWFDHYVKGA